MPSWKKVITSGSAAALNSLTVTNGITGSLFGTASFASFATSASFALTSSFLGSTTNAFIQNGNSFGATALLGTNDNNSLALETNGTTRMFISSSGAVGIGKTTPTATLDVSGSAIITGSLDLVYNTASSNGISVTGHFPRLLLINSGSGATASGGAITTRDENFATKTSGQTIFSLAATNAGSSVVGRIFFTKASSTSTNINFNNSGGSAVMFISGSGDVGIGTITPGAKLDVSGSAIISGSFTVIPGTVREFQVNTTGVDIGNLITDAHTVTGSLSISGSLNVGISTITAARIAASSAGANAVFTQATGSFTGAKYLYTVTSASNARTGEVMAVWNGTSVQYTDNSTLDIGSTTAVTASVSIVSAQAQFNMQTNTSGWTIKSQVTYL